MMPLPQRVGNRQGMAARGGGGEIIDAVLCLLSLFLQVVQREFLLSRVVLMSYLLFLQLQMMISKSAIIAYFVSHTFLKG